MGCRSEVRWKKGIATTAQKRAGERHAECKLKRHGTFAGLGIASKMRGAAISAKRNLRRAVVVRWRQTFNPGHKGTEWRRESESVHALWLRASVVNG
jgi:hypothetical protein